MLQDVVTLTYIDACQARNQTVLASFVDPGTITISAPLTGVSIQHGSSLTITVWDSDLDTDPNSTEVLAAFSFDASGCCHPCVVAARDALYPCMILACAQTVQGRVVLESLGCKTSQMVSVDITETSNHSRAFTGAIKIGSRAGGNEMELDCFGGAPCFVNATYTDANFGSTWELARTEAAAMVSVSGTSETARLGTLPGFGANVFVAGESLSVTVQDFVVDQAVWEPPDPVPPLAQSVRVHASTSNNDQEVNSSYAQ